MGQSACLVVNSIIVLINCKTVGQASDYLSLAWTTVAQFEVFLRSDYLRVVSSIFVLSCSVSLIRKFTTWLKETCGNCGNFTGEWL